LAQFGPDLGLSPVCGLTGIRGDPIEVLLERFGMLIHLPMESIRPIPLC